MATPGKNCRCKCHDPAWNVKHVVACCSRGEMLEGMKRLREEVERKKNDDGT